MCIRDSSDPLRSVTCMHCDQFNQSIIVTRCIFICTSSTMVFSLWRSLHFFSKSFIPKSKKRIRETFTRLHCCFVYPLYHRYFYLSYGKHLMKLSGSSPQQEASWFLPA